MPDLTGQHAIVTGGGSGIGLAIARALDDAGAVVTITGRRQSALDDAARESPGLHPLVMDVTIEKDVVDGIAEAVEKRGPLSICIANAGIAEGRSFHKMDLAFWRKIIATNLDGVFLTIREAMKSMRDAPTGRIIAISSIAGVRGLRGAPAYTASKHGVVGLIRGLSEDNMGGPITFNALCPGYVDTDIVTRNTEEISKRAGLSEEDARQTMIRANRHKRLMHVSEIAAAALWLCDPASNSVNGQTIEISGGQT